MTEHRVVPNKATFGVVTFENVDAYTFRLIAAAPEMAELLASVAENPSYEDMLKARALLSRIQGEA